MLYTKEKKNRHTITMDDDEKLIILNFSEYEIIILFKG